VALGALDMPQRYSPRPFGYLARVIQRAAPVNSAATAAEGPWLLSRRAELSIVALIVLAGFALRAAALGQSLLGDELFTYQIATRHSLGGVLDGVTSTELNPPLYFVLAWLAAKLGDPLIAIRVPSLMFATAAMPMVWLVGRRTVGRVPALLGTALYALAPFAVYYGSEARAYSALTFLAVASTYALLRALEEGGGRRWWALYAAASAGVMYTHYTGLFVLVAQAAWALWFHRDRWRPLAVSCGAAALAYVPWLPFIRENVPVDIIKLVFPLTPRNFVRGQARLFPGHPYAGIDQVPGKVGLAMVLLGVAGAAALAIAPLVRARVRPALSPGVVLAVALAVSSSIGAVLADWAGQPIYLPRNLIASLPPLCLALGALVVRLPRPAAVATGALIAGGVGLGTYHALQPANGRPQYKAAAHWVDQRARPGDPVAQIPGFRARGILKDSFSVNFERPHPVFTVDTQGRQALAAADRRGRLFVITLRAAGVPAAPVPHPPLRLVAHRGFPGTTPVEALEYAAP
jgi:4-amino-4-deoxy-L-arabinose transferase-like glycosyltransferase